MGVVTYFHRLGRSLVLPALALAVLLAGCMGLGEPQLRPTSDCFGSGDRSRPAGAPAMVALLTGNRLLRISLPGGAVEAERRIGPRSSGRPVDQLDAFRITTPSGPSLATAADGRTVVALVRRPASEGDRVAVIDAQSLRVRCTHALVKGVRHTGLLVGRSGRFYASGNRSTGTRGRWDAVLTTGDAQTGMLERTQTLRRAAAPGEPARGAKNWYVYWAALSADERRLILSFHSDTTGGDWFRISRGGQASAGDMDQRRCAGRRPDWPCGPGRTDISWLHGAVASVGTGFLGTTGNTENELLELDLHGRESGRLRARGTSNHVMDFALDSDRPLAYFSLCARRPTLHRFDLARDDQKVLPGGPFCGRPLAVHDDRFLLVDATPVSKRGYTRNVEPQLRLYDLDRPGSSRPIRRSGGALDAVVVAR